MENTTVNSNLKEAVTEDGKVLHRDFAPHRRVSIRICKECGKTYVLSDNDAVHYITTYGSLPLRCDVCREKKRVAMPYTDEKPTDATTL
jgi:hypothetical protein